MQAMEQQLQQLVRENQKLSQNQGKARPATDEELTLKDITKQNAQLRRKLDDALQKISALEKK